MTIWGECLYFFGKPTDIKDSWIRYIQALQQWLLEAISSTQSLSVLLSVMEKSCATQTILLLACWPSLAVIPTCVGVLSSLAAATLWERRVFCSGLPTVRLYLRAGIIRAWHLFEEIRYLVARMSPTFNTSSDTQHFKCGNALEIQHWFPYLGLSHTPSIPQIECSDLIVAMHS